MTDWKEVHGTQDEKPAELDTSSSRFTVYERRNIRQEQVTLGPENEQITEWVYDERTYTKEEYNLLTSPAVQALMQSLSAIELNQELMMEV